MTPSGTSQDFRSPRSGRTMMTPSGTIPDFRSPSGGVRMTQDQTPSSTQSLKIRKFELESESESSEEMDITAPISGSSIVEPLCSTPTQSSRMKRLKLNLEDLSDDGEMFNTPPPSSRRSEPPSSPSPLRLSRTFKGLSQGRFSIFVALNTVFISSYLIAGPSADDNADDNDDDELEKTF